MVTVWLLSTTVFVVVIVSGATRELSDPSMGGKGPSLCGWEYSASGRLTSTHSSF